MRFREGQTTIGRRLRGRLREGTEQVQRGSERFTAKHLGAVAAELVRAARVRPQLDGRQRAELRARLRGEEAVESDALLAFERRVDDPALARRRA